MTIPLMERPEFWKPSLTKEEYNLCKEILEREEDNIKLIEHEFYMQTGDQIQWYPKFKEAKLRGYISDVEFDLLSNYVNEGWFIFKSYEDRFPPKKIVSNGNGSGAKGWLIIIISTIIVTIISLLSKIN
jgi:hypothetical protein